MRLLGLALLGCILLSPALGEIEKGFVQKTVEIAGEVFHYQVYVPQTWSGLEEWPVILALHGRGESGSDGVSQTRVGFGPAVRRSPSFPALVVFPQCRRGLWWNDPKMESLVLASLEATLRDYHGDEDRVYLTGHSMGGYGTLYFGAKYTGKFAALVSVCGGVIPPNRSSVPNIPLGRDPYEETAKRIGQTPVWLFHGTSDPVVPVAESRRMADALGKIGRRVKYSEYEGVGHNSWDRAYAEPGLVGWMLSQRR